ncbi:tetratricopeptide repeat protein [Myroides odoratus]|uniref:tetratricopeptide repeat protein n=1 Tax=Myroides odoratus TaxID=256 RepID=UPI000765A6B4|nr:tetratricopeptide repeat protein [Myroides odoratus]
MRTLILLFFLWGSFASWGQSKQEKLIDQYLTQGAYRYHYTLQGWQDQIDLALAQDSTLAILWQNKALPYWKTKKYNLAVACYDQAVRYDRKNYLGRRGYLKCIFQRDYKGAIQDMQQAEQEFGYDYQNDHSYAFYIALCHLQLNAFEEAKNTLEKDINRTIQKHGESWLHHLDLFYMGIIYYELREYTQAQYYLDKALIEYPKFSDAQYYKGLCFLAQNNKTEARNILLQAQENAKQGYTINEDDAYYESYPYQVNWHMAQWTIPQDTP